VPLFDPGAFRIPPGTVHVCAGGETPVLRRHAAAFERYGADKSMGPASRPRVHDEAERLRARLGAFWRVAPEEIGLVSSVALLARLDAAGIAPTTPRDPARHGANVCIAHDRAASIVAAMAEHGVLAWNGRGRIRFRFHGCNDAAELDRIMDALHHAF
jgi:selenocysteine lyase/cysteine desulfurase